VSFAREGCTRIVLGDLSYSGLEETRSLITSEFPRAIVVVHVTNVSIRGDVTALFDAAIGRFSRVDYAVNAAGVIGQASRSHEMSIDEFDKVLSIDYKGCWLCSREELKYMVKQEPLETHDGRKGNRG
jgi:NAD(P)-dependent dehydrogenase (short-subunit alcohol dehydrogenase family)